MRRETDYFRDVTLLLTGGGVPGIAFAGACLAGESRGCNFRAAAGTSFGSIVAALVAARFSGREIVRAIRSAPVFFASPLSEAVEHWINDQLRKKLGIDKAVVTFSDLPRPLIILAVDLSLGQASAWSRAT